MRKRPPSLSGLSVLVQRRRLVGQWAGARLVREQQPHLAPSETPTEGADDQRAVATSHGVPVIASRKVSPLPRGVTGPPAEGGSGVATRKVSGRLDGQNLQLAAYGGRPSAT